MCSAVRCRWRPLQKEHPSPNGGGRAGDPRFDVPCANDAAHASSQCSNIGHGTLRRRCALARVSNPIALLNAPLKPPATEFNPWTPCVHGRFLHRGLRRNVPRGCGQTPRGEQPLCQRRHLRRHGVGRRLCDRGAQALPLTVTVAVALTSRPRHGQVHPKIHVPYLLISDSAHAPLHSLPGAAALAAPASRVQHWCGACPTPSPTPQTPSPGPEAEPGPNGGSDPPPDLCPGGRRARRRCPPPLTRRARRRRPRRCSCPPASGWRRRPSASTWRRRRPPPICPDLPSPCPELADSLGLLTRPDVPLISP